MALTVQFQLNPSTGPFVPTVKVNKMLQHRPSGKAGGRRGAREQVPDSAQACKMGEPTRGVGEPNPPRETKTSGVNGSRN